MSTTRAFLSASLLLLSVASLAPMASASIDNVWVCLGTKRDTCDHNDVVEVNVKNHRVEVCAITTQGACEPYDGDVARVEADGHQVSVPDPCYTTACF